MADLHMYYLEDMDEGKELNGVLSRLLSQKLIVPFIGSGFTSGKPSLHGHVPNVAEMCEYIAGTIKRGLELTSDDINDIDQLAKQNKLAELFQIIMEEFGENNAPNSKAAWINVFRGYISDNFTNVHDLSFAQKRFLDIDWEYLYTLNYDDAIENYCNGSAKGSNSLDVGVPYNSFDAKWLTSNNRRCLIKIHGDARKFIQTGDLNYIILTSSQYMNLLSSRDNGMIRAELVDDFNSKAPLFVGCSLTNEFDLLFASEDDISKVSASAQDNSFFVRYVDDPKSKLTIGERTKLKSYGIKNIINISPSQIDAFYSKLADIDQEVKKICSISALEQYTGYRFAQLGKNDEMENVLSLYSTKSLIDLKQKLILLPFYYIHRSIEKEISESIDSGITINIILGRRLSGKTYLLLGLLKKYAQSGKKKIYYISGIKIARKFMPLIKRNKDCIYLFDAGTISATQLKEDFLKDVCNLQGRGIQIILAVRSSDLESIRYLYREWSSNPDVFRYFDLPNKLDASENNSFNENIGQLLWINKAEKETFYDYMIRLDDSLLRNDSECYFFRNVNVFEYGGIDKLKAFIVLALNPAISSHYAANVNITNELVMLTQSTDGIIQSDYLNILQRESHSGAVYVANSTFWIRRCLSHLADSEANFEFISDAYESIVDDLLYVREMRPSELSDYDFNSTIGVYINLDAMQEIFYAGTKAGGSLKLPEMVFSRLASKLNDRYQFLHQYAKCLYRLSGREKHLDSSDNYLSTAKKCIDRAISLTENSGGLHKDETLAHMSVTRCLIMARYLYLLTKRNQKLTLDLIKKTVTAFLTVYDTYRSNLDEFIRDGSSNNDLKWFFSNLGSDWVSIYKGSGIEDDVAHLFKCYAGITVKIKG